MSAHTRSQAILQGGSLQGPTPQLARCAQQTTRQASLDTHHHITHTQKSCHVPVPTTPMTGRERNFDPTAARVNERVPTRATRPVPAIRASLKCNKNPTKSKLITAEQEACGFEHCMVTRRKFGSKFLVVVVWLFAKISLLVPHNTCSCDVPFRNYVKLKIKFFFVLSLMLCETVQWQL